MSSFYVSPLQYPYPRALDSFSTIVSALASITLLSSPSIFFTIFFIFSSPLQQHCDSVFTGGVNGKQKSWPCLPLPIFPHLFSGMYTTVLGLKYL